MNLRLLKISTVLAGVLLASTGSVRAGDLLDYCPDETKSAWLIDVAELQSTDVGKLITGNRPFFEYLKLEIERRDPKAKDTWTANPQVKILVEFVGKTSRVILCDFGGFLNFATIYEGEYDADRLEKLLSDNAGDKSGADKKDGAGDETKLKRVNGKNYVHFEKDGIRMYLLNQKVLVVCFEANYKFFDGHLDREEIKQSTARSVASVRNAFADPSVWYAFAYEYANRALFGKDERTYDMAEGHLAFRREKIEFRMTQSHDTPEQTTATKDELTKTRNAMAASLEGSALAAPFKAVTVEVEGKNVVVRGDAPTKALHESMEFLLDKLLKPN